jgi:polyketide synthase PksN
MDAAMIRNDVLFADYGVDSIIGVNLVRTLNDMLEIELEPTKLFEYNTVDQLAQYISTCGQEQTTVQPPQIQSVSPESSQSTDGVSTEANASSEERIVNFVHESCSRHISADSIAIIGLSGRFAESESLGEFWQNVKQGKDLVKKVSRWSPTDCVIPGSAGHGYCSHGSFVESIDEFDPAFFGISPEDAICMDPQQRLFLEESWRALEDAGYAGKSVQEKQCGVYVGCGGSNYDSLFAGDPPARAFWDNQGSAIAARVSYYLKLQGPAIAVNTACSSSLVAIHLACQALWTRETEMALAGGVCVQATPAFYQFANRAGLLSPEGKCYSFDARANGFVPGEGVGVLVLKRLQDALKDGDYVYGVLAGSSINQDGSSNSLTTPNAGAQERLERSVYDRFKINPETIQVVEAYGSGTLLGDSIEWGAISRVIREYTDKKQFCAIGTVKTNIGHAGAAAGVASVLKILLSLKHHQIPPCLLLQKGNPAIDIESSPFYVNTQLKEWPVEGKQNRRAAVSSFGLSGTNAHLVIEEAPSIERPTVESPGYLVVLSALTSEQLQRQVRNLLAFLKDAPGLSLNDLSFTLLVGRMHLIQRLSCIARHQQELIRLLEQWLETGAAKQIYISEVQEGKAREQAALKKFGNYCIQQCKNGTNAESYLEQLTTIADLYVQGYSLDFHALFSSSSKRMPLPTYPFAKEHYWIDSSSARARSTASDRLASDEQTNVKTP